MSELAWTRCFIPEASEMKLEPWQTMVLETLRELSDASLQERVWLRGEGGEVSSPTEVVNQLFDDSGLSDLLEGDLVFSEEADFALRQLSEHVDTINLRSLSKIFS
jgi:hypothetical protein